MIAQVIPFPRQRTKHTYAPNGKLIGSHRPDTFFYRKLARTGCESEVREEFLLLVREYEQLLEWIDQSGLNAPTQGNYPADQVREMIREPVTDFEWRLALADEGEEEEL